MNRTPYLLFLLPLLILSFSCSLDIPVEDEITGLDAIDNVPTAEEALSSAYRTYPKNKITFSKLADDFYPNHTISENSTDYNLYKWAAIELIYLSGPLWTSHYSTISKVNVLLERIPEIPLVNDQEGQQLDFIHAQALCLKALSYLDLLQAYAPVYSEEARNEPGIILKDKIDAEERPRATVETSYQETERLLLKAIALFPSEGNTKYRFSKKSAQALLAKVYFNWNRYEKAITLCDELLSTALSEQSYVKMWKSPENNQEVLLAFENRSFNYAPIFDGTAHEDEYYANFGIRYSDGDYRKGVNFIEEDFRLQDNSLIKANFLGKYRTVLTDESPKPILSIRQAELHFIKAESLYRSFREEEAKNTLNTFLELRNAGKITSSGATFLKDLLKEKQKEFLGEGIRYFDLKRNALPLHRVNYSNHAILSNIKADDFRWLLPIPENEIRQNKKAKQNPDWEKLI